MKFQPFEQWTAGLAFATLALTLPAIASEPVDPDKQRTVIKAMMHIDVTEAEAVLGLLDVDYALKPDQDLIVIRGEGYAVDTALKVIDALDSPRPTIDLHVFVLSASTEGQVDVPADLEAAVGQLRKIFGYSGFELLDNVTLRVLEGRSGRAEGGVRLGDDRSRTGYHFTFQKVSVVPEDDVNRIRIKGLEFEVDGATEGVVRAGLKTDIQIREGQKAVIGSSTPEGDGDTLILIVEATASPDRNGE